jgi:hypothetical protein
MNLTAPIPLMGAYEGPTKCYLIVVSPGQYQVWPLTHGRILEEPGEVYSLVREVKPGVYETLNEFCTTLTRVTAKVTGEYQDRSVAFKAFSLPPLALSALMEASPTEFSEFLEGTALVTGAGVLTEATVAYTAKPILQSIVGAAGIQQIH